MRNYLVYNFFFWNSRYPFFSHIFGHAPMHFTELGIMSIHITQIVLSVTALHSNVLFHFFTVT
jgi:hypothetical protein